MESIKNFDEFYEVKLKEYLHQLKVQKRLFVFWISLIVLLVFALIPTLVVALSNDATISNKFILGCVVTVLIISIHQSVINGDAFEEGFKSKVIGQIINFIHPDLIYKSGMCINVLDYKRSCLFRNNFYNYSGDDLISGIYKNINFKCSELYVSPAKGRRVSDPIFRGLFFAAPLNTSFSGGTYIWRNNNIQLPASIADEAYRMMPMPDIIKVDFQNSDFQQYYSVYTTDLYEASTIVTEEMMQNILKFSNQINRDATLSFVGGICYVAIPFEDPLFETFGNNPANKEEIKEYFFTVLLILSIINQLKLYNI